MTIGATATQPRDDALAIWHAGVDAVRSDRLVCQQVQVDGGRLRVGSQQWPLESVGRIAVVGCGKAGAGMAAGLEAALGDAVLEEKNVIGWVNVPAGCQRPLRRIHLHAARPAGFNEPTQAGVEGAERILELVASLGPRDLCFCLLSGGGSALLPAPVEGISLADKQAVTKFLSGAGANIQQLNTVRKQLSRIKGGGLARACRAGQLVSLIISDVLGDPLDVIASGPTVDDSTSPADALAVLEQFGARQAELPEAVFAVLQNRQQAASTELAKPGGDVTNLVIGNNATAVAAAAAKAEALDYKTHSQAVTDLEGEAERIGEQLADRAAAMRGAGRSCFISGGEPVVRLAPPEKRGLGGRNQQLVLAALRRLLDTHPDRPLANQCLLSGGTDGEDGPTDAAGALIDRQIVDALGRTQLDPADFLQRNDAYHFFQSLGGLIKTGPTDTNVCDLRVVVVGK